MVLVEGGVAWLAPLIWRLTDHWRSMRAEVPWMVRPPLEYLHRNVRLTTQPLENPDDPSHLAALLQSIDAQRMLMFASDYPHFDFDSPAAVSRRLPRAHAAGDPARQRRAPVRPRRRFRPGTSCPPIPRPPHPDRRVTGSGRGQRRSQEQGRRSTLREREPAGRPVPAAAGVTSR